MAFNGSEPIRPETWRGSRRRSNAGGFRPEVFYSLLRPGGGDPDRFGSEGSLSAREDVPGTRTGIESRARSTGRRKGRPDTRELRAILPGQEIAIVDPELLTECPSDQVGEIWISGPSIAQGYWNRAEETERTFRARLSQRHPGPFLRSGDLGFVHHGELFVTGRLKDLIIIRGRNHYPSDIEQTVERCHAALRPGCGAAFSVVVAGDEKLVIVQEVDARRQLDLGAVLETIRQAVVAEHEVPVHAVVLIQPASIPKTSNGKIQRHACRARFLEEGLKVVAKWRESATAAEEDSPVGLADPDAGPEEIGAWLTLELASRLGVDASKLDLDQPIARYAVDSLIAAEFAHRIEATLGVGVPIADLLRDTSLRQIAARVVLERQRSPSASGDGARLPEVDDHRLSFGQQTLWFLHQLAPESTAYNIVTTARIRGDVDPPALRRSFQGLVDRHASLRTTFFEAEAAAFPDDTPSQTDESRALELKAGGSGLRAGEPRRQVHPHMEVAFQHHEASTWSSACLNERLAEESGRRFDLATGPLLRVSLFSRSPQEHILLLAIHHIVADFWSLALLARELGVLYAAEISGARPSLPSPALEYSDYVKWQAAMMASPEGARLETYWQKQLGGRLPVLDLPTDRPRPPVQTYRGASCSFELGVDLTRGLRDLGAARGATLYMTLLASFQALLHRYTGQEDLQVGSPTTGRSRPEWAGLAGYFVNPVVLRAELGGDLPFDSFLERVRATVLAALEHQDYPFGLLVERLQPERDPSRSPIFQAMFALQKARRGDDAGLAGVALGEAGARMEVAGLSLETMAQEPRGAPVDLTLMIADGDTALTGSLQYNSDLFDEATIRRMIEHYRNVLSGIVADPAQRIRSLPLIGAGERRQLLVEWNATAAGYPLEGCLDELFEAQAERNPDAVALVFEGDQLTYGELNRRANQLARHLRTLGVGPDAAVGICLERSLALLVGILGILKAGGAYVPLDPDYPRERLAFMIEDTQAPVVLTREGLAAKLPEERTQLVLLDSQREVIARENEENLKCGTTPDNLAYVIYTSGSTGTPKGVGVVHRGVVRLAHGAHYADLSSNEVFLQLAPLSFDASTFEIWACLLNGARLVIFGAEPPTLESLGETLARHQVTTLWLTASVFHEIVERRIEALSGVRQVLTGGDVVSTRHVRKVLRQLEGCRLINGYGPTEGTTFTCCHMRLLRTSGRQLGPDRPADRQHRSLYSGRAARAGTDRRRRRAVRRRRGGWRAAISTGRT